MGNVPLLQAYVLGLSSQQMALLGEVVDLKEAELQWRKQVTGGGP